MAIPIAEATSEALAPLAAKTVVGIVTDGLIFEASKTNADGQGNAGSAQTSWTDLIAGVAGVLENDCVPAMTSATVPGGVVSSDGDYSTNYCWKAFDDSLSTYWTANGTTGYLRYQFVSARVIVKYSVKPTWVDGAPKNWTLQGSNNGTNWTTLDTQTGITWTSGDLSAKAFTFSNSTAYVHYKFNVSLVGVAGNYPSVTDLQLIAPLPTWDADGLNLGSGGYANFGDPSALELGAGPRTVSMWWKPDTVSAWHYIFKKRQLTDVFRGWGLRQNNVDTFQFVVQNSSTAYRTAVSTGTATVGTWIHVVGVYNGSECYIYVNGAENTASRADDAGSYDTDNSVDLTVGYRSDGGLADGHVAQVLLYNRALSAVEIKRLYDAGRNATSTSLPVAEAAAQAFAATPHDEAGSEAVPTAESVAEALVVMGATTSPAAPVAEASVDAPAPDGSGTTVGAALAEASAEATSPAGIAAGIASATAEATADAFVATPYNPSSVSAAEASAEAVIPVGAAVNPAAVVAEATAQAMVVSLPGGGPSLRRSYPAMVRTYPPLCRAA